VALITAAQYREFYPQITGTAEDTLFGSFIDRADALMAVYCGYRRNAAGVMTMASSSYALKYNGPSTQPTVLPLGAAPLVSVSHLYVDTDRAFGASTELVQGTDFDLDLPGGRIGLLPGGSLTRFPVATQAILVDFVAGFASTPPDLVAACATVVRHLWDRRATEGTPSLTVFGDSATKSDLDALIPAAVRAHLDAGYLVVSG
jgi:hypothetical protein